jgi:hypothetical protein
MHASVGGEVQSNPVSSVLAAQLFAGPQDARREDLRDLVQTLVDGHEVGMKFAHGAPDPSRGRVCRHSISNRSTSASR